MRQAGKLANKPGSTSQSLHHKGKEQDRTHARDPGSATCPPQSHASLGHVCNPWKGKRRSEEREADLSTWSNVKVNLFSAESRLMVLTLAKSRCDVKLSVWKLNVKITAKVLSRHKNGEEGGTEETGNKKVSVCLCVWTAWAAREWNGERETGGRC